MLLWVGYEPRRLSADARSLIGDEANDLLFSAISIAEVAIKYARGQPDFRVDPHILRRQLIDNGYAELALSAEHAAAVADLPPIHKDPFDRLLLAQARVEAVLLLTADKVMARYAGLTRTV
jgi:PIN domain nuclease of toxin-antitoxin system